MTMPMHTRAGRLATATGLARPRPARRSRPRIAALAAVGLLGGCVTATVEQVRSGDTGLTSTESVVVLGRRQGAASDTEVDFVNCVGKQLNSINVVPEAQFVDSMFPWFEPRTAPTTASDLPELLARPGLTEAVARAGIRYVVWLDGATTTVDESGALTCAVGPGGGGCFGFLTWEKDASYEALVWDIRTARTVGKISADANGTSYMPALILPVPLIAQVESSACSGLADQLERFIIGS